MRRRAAWSLPIAPGNARAVNPPAMPPSGERKLYVEQLLEKMIRRMQGMLQRGIYCQDDLEDELKDLQYLKERLT